MPTHMGSGHQKILKRYSRALKRKSLGLKAVSGEIENFIFGVPGQRAFFFFITLNAWDC